MQNVKPPAWKRTLAGILAAWMTMFAIGAVPAAYAAEEGQSDTVQVSGGTFALSESVDAAILIDVATGQVLYEKNADTPRPPASMTKLMTEYIVLDRIKSGQLSWDAVIKTSKEAASTPPDGSQIYLAEGDEDRKSVV